MSAAATVMLLDQGGLGDKPLTRAGRTGQCESRRSGALADDCLRGAGAHGAGVRHDPVPAAVVLAGVGAGAAFASQGVDADGGVAVAGGGASELVLPPGGVGVAGVGASAATRGEDGGPVGAVGGTGIDLGVPRAQRDDIGACYGVGVGPVEGGRVDGQHVAAGPLHLGGVDAVAAWRETVVAADAGAARCRGGWSGLAGIGYRLGLAGRRGAARAAEREGRCGEDCWGYGSHDGWSFRVSGDSLDEGDGAPNGLAVDTGGLAVCGDHLVVAGVDSDVVVGARAPKKQVSGLGLGKAGDGCAVAGLGVGEVGQGHAQACRVLLGQSGAVVAAVRGAFSAPDVGVAVVRGDGLCPGDRVGDAAAGCDLGAAVLVLVVGGVGGDDLDIVLGLTEGGDAAGIQDSSQSGVVGGKREGDGVSREAPLADGFLDLVQLVAHVPALGGDGVSRVVDVGDAVVVVVLADGFPGVRHELCDSASTDWAGHVGVPAGLLSDLGGNETRGDAVAHRAGGVDQVSVLGRDLVGGGPVAGGGLRLVEQDDDSDESQEQGCSGGDPSGDLLHGIPHFGGK